MDLVFYLVISSWLFFTILQVSSSEIVGGLLLQSPSMDDFDHREMFCFYLYPGKRISSKVSYQSHLAVKTSTSGFA